MCATSEDDQCPVFLLDQDSQREGVASYASHPLFSRGRFYRDDEGGGGGDPRAYSKDKGRILQSRAFRRLSHKTQVFFTGYEGDHYRTRLTHSLEVAHVARTLAYELGVMPDLAEAIALAHDLGHPPFGHAGERALQECMAEEGGFDHNLQALKIISRLEKYRPGFLGLNLSWETMEGLLKHNGPFVRERSAVPEEILAFCERVGLGLELYPSAEAQIASLSDDIAYHAHDLDDGLRAGFFTIEELESLTLTRLALENVRKKWLDSKALDIISPMISEVRSLMKNDLLSCTSHQIRDHRITTSDEVRYAGCPIVGFSSWMVDVQQELRIFLHKRFYGHESVVSTMNDAEDIVRILFEWYRKNPSCMPNEWQNEDGDLERISDFISGMTDRYALLQVDKLFSEEGIEDSFLKRKKILTLY